jgi:hypothetical protein
MKLTGNIGETIRIPFDPVTRITIDLLTMTWTIIPAKREPTAEEKIVHRAISFSGGDTKRFGHGQFVGDDE